MSPALRRAIETCDARHLHPANELLCAGKGGLAVYLPINGIGALEKPRLTLVTAIQGWVWPCSWPVHSYFRQRAVERKRQPMNSEEAEQLAGRSRSRLPPFGRRYAKPPAAALLTGQVARELASTLKRLRLVRSFHLPWPRRASCCTQFITALRESRFTALANGLELGFVVPRQALSGMGVDFSEPATRRFSISGLRPRRSDRCQD